MLWGKRTEISIYELIFSTSSYQKWVEVFRNMGSRWKCLRTTLKLRTVEVVALNLQRFSFWMRFKKRGREIFENTF
jgi:hypothetical protein